MLLTEALPIPAASRPAGPSATGPVGHGRAALAVVHPAGAVRGASWGSPFPALKELTSDFQHPADHCRCGHTWFLLEVTKLWFCWVLFFQISIFTSFVIT